MKQINEFISYFQSLDVKLWVRNDQLNYSAPQGILTPTLKSQLRERKLEIVEFLKEKEFNSSISIELILPVSRDMDLPLSFAQQRLWFLQQLDPRNSFYNGQQAFHLLGSLDVAVLEQSFNKILQRHESLRTAFKLVGEQPIQVILPSLDFTLPVIDLCQLPADQQQREVQQLSLEQSQYSFDLAQAPLLRLTLLKLDEQKHILLLTGHHIVGDGWSIGLLLHELSALYKAFVAGKPASLPELSIQYADFAFWQRQRFEEKKLETQIAYWKSQLANSPPLLRLPTDRSRPPIQTYRGARQSFLLPRRLAKTFQLIAQKAGSTLFMTLLTAFKILLYRYAGEEDVIVGSAVANRTRAEVEDVFGCFVNTIVLRTDISNSPTFNELLGRVRKGVIDAYANQDAPFEKLVEELQPERNVNYNPLFQVSFALRNTSKMTFELPGLTVTPFQFEHTKALFDLHLDIAETDLGLEGFWEYNTDLFDAARISRMSAHFQTLLNAIADNPQQRVSK
ncbi:MAG: condensation domain-containing protein, partial [Cyanobacteria bacterium P01_F01_bin.53]